MGEENLFPVSPGDTVNFTFTDPSGTVRYYSQLKEPILSQVRNAYKDSVRKFYTDTAANASFRPYKIFNSPFLRLMFEDL
jgi:plastocyanin